MRLPSNPHEELPTIPANIDPRMVVEIALGMESPVDIAYRYGINASQFRALEQHKPFLAEVAAKRAELERGGQTVKVKAAWMTENLLDDLYLKAKDNNASIGQLQETIKLTAKLADLEPKGSVAAAGAAGPAFQVVINLPTSYTKNSATASVEASQQVLTFPTFAAPTEEIDITPTDTPKEE